ncbi:TSC22 domain family protein 4-like [Passer domesticus]|uniref:TSC22 domain family protein 4-like n=1 Tax=Passer domesticus TaxID=48849 RepID=UPI0030FE6313
MAADAASGARRRRRGAPWRPGGPGRHAAAGRGSARAGRGFTPRGGVAWGGTALKRGAASASRFRVPPPPPPPPVTAPGRPRHVPPPPPAAAAPMSRKKSGFAITSVRGGSAAAPADASGAASGAAAAAPAPSGSPGGSRFRLVRLLPPGEALRRGRWLCRDFYEREAAAGRGGGRVPVSLGAPRAGPAPPRPRSLGAFAELVQQALPPKPPSPRPGGGAELSARLGLAGEESEEEGAGSGVSAIDNKIERAMDLVKSHLLLAVREEVEALREQIRELTRAPRGAGEGEPPAAGAGHAAAAGPPARAAAAAGAALSGGTPPGVPGRVPGVSGGGAAADRQERTERRRPSCAIWGLFLINPRFLQHGGGAVVILG